MITQTTPTLELAIIDEGELLDARTRQTTDGLRRPSASIAGSPENKKEDAQ